MKYESRALPNESRSKRNSRLDEVYLPIGIAVIPSALFALLGLIIRGMDKPLARPPVPMIVTMVTVEILGIVAMAVVILVRHGHASKALLLSANGEPHAVRKVMLLFSIACLLLFDILTNVAAAFPGGGILLIAAVPTFAVYLLFNRLAFVGLRE